MRIVSTPLNRLLPGFAGRTAGPNLPERVMPPSCHRREMRPVSPVRRATRAAMRAYPGSSPGRRSTRSPTLPVAGPAWENPCTIEAIARQRAPQHVGALRGGPRARAGESECRRGNRHAARRDSLNRSRGRMSPVTRDSREKIEQAESGDQAQLVEAGRRCLRAGEQAAQRRRRPCSASSATSPSCRTSEVAAGHQNEPRAA